MYSNEVEILLVEDSMADAEMTIRALKKVNLANKLIHVKDGRDALDFLFGEGTFTGRELTKMPKVILLDIKMPKVNGIEVLQVIKSDIRTKTTPVVMLTSSKEDPDIRQCYELGANSYIVKPVNFDGFTQAIMNLGFYWLLLNQQPS
jgi:two-component system response regulator